MTLDLAVLLAITVTASATGFVAYWIGVGHAERRARAREAALLDDLDFATDLLAASPSTPVLRVIAGGA